MGPEAMSTVVPPLPDASIPAGLRVPATMRAAVLDAPGGADAFRIAEVPAPTPVNAELLVRVVAAGVNPIDLRTRAGDGVAAAIGSWPAVLGLDFSGVVVTSPYEAFPLQPGDEVFGISGAPRTAGSYAELVTACATSVVRKPPILSHVEAAGVPLAALTAWGVVVELAKAHEGQRILIHAASGGVGHLAVQLAAYFGAHVIAAAEEPDAAWLRDLGAREVVDTARMRFEDVLDRVDAVIDLVGDRRDRTGPRSLRVLRRNGLLVNVPSGSWPGLVTDCTAAGVRCTTFRAAPDAAVLAVVARLIGTGDIRVHVDAVHPLEEVAAAHRLLATGRVRGKAVLRITPPR